MTMFSVLAVLIFGMAFDLRVPRSEMVAPGVLWVVILFAGVLGLNRSFGAEMDRGHAARAAAGADGPQRHLLWQGAGEPRLHVGHGFVILVVMFFV
jgi:ABC-type transport system involved in cytochrome c biogenesis permease component